jgi:glycosyltransferase involved in cell wall biosynthesis
MMHFHESKKKSALPVTKVLFIHLLNDYSGSPKILSQVINLARTNQIDFALYTGNDSKGFLSGLTKNQHFYFYKRFNNKYFTLLSFLLSQVILFGMLLKYWNKNVVIYVNTMLPFGASLAGWLMRKPVYYHIHEIYIKPKRLKVFLRQVIQLTARKIIFVSKTVKDAEAFEDKLQFLLPNSLPDDWIQFAKNHKYKSIHGTNFNVLMISSLKIYKGVNEFVELATLMQHEINFKFTLILNASKHEINDFFKARILPKNLNLINKKKDVKPFLQEASLVLNLSRPNECIETFGLTILEALAFGIPVIVPPVGGPSELVTDGQEGFLLDSCKTEQISDKIRELAVNPELCQLLSINARKRSLEFTEMKFNNKLLRILEI